MFQPVKPFMKSVRKQKPLLDFHNWFSVDFLCPISSPKLEIKEEFHLNTRRLFRVHQHKNKNNLILSLGYDILIFP